MLRCVGVECEEAALTRSPVPEQLKLSPPPPTSQPPAPGPDTGPNGQHHSALQSSTLRHGPANIIIPTDIYTFYYCVTNLFLCKVSAWLEYDLTNHHASAQKSTRPLLLSSARPEQRCGYLYLCGPAEDAWLRHRCGVWLVGGGGREAAGTLSPLWHRTCPLHTCTPLALVTNNTSYVYPQLNYTQPRYIQDLLIHQ